MNNIKARTRKNATATITCDIFAFDNIVIALQTYASTLREHGCPTYADDVWKTYEQLSKAFDRIHKAFEDKSDVED